MQIQTLVCFDNGVVDDDDGLFGEQDSFRTFLSLIGGESGPFFILGEMSSYHTKEEKYFNLGHVIKDNTFMLINKTFTSVRRTSLFFKSNLLPLIQSKNIPHQLPILHHFFLHRFPEGRKAFTQCCT